MRMRLPTGLVALSVAALLGWSGAAAAEPGIVKGSVSLPSGSPRDAVVLLEGRVAGAAPGKGVIDQKDMTFVPHVIAVTRGSTVEFLNSEPVLHNVFSISAAKKFDVGMFGQGESRSVTFDTPGVVEVRCIVHPKMLAFIVVAENDLFAIPDEQGNYQINGVPPGRYKLRAWHESFKPVETWVNLEEAKLRTVDVRFK